MPDRKQDQPPSQGELAGGSGFIVSPEGYILTNNHVVEDADQVRVYLSNRRYYDAKIIGADPFTDVAVIKIEGEDPAEFHQVFQRDYLATLSLWEHYFGEGSIIGAGSVILESIPDKGVCMGKPAELLAVSSSGFYAWLEREPSRREQENRCLTEHIRVLHQRMDAERYF